MLFRSVSQSRYKGLHCAFPDKIQTKYVELLVHESCHMDQWIENTKYWSIERENNSLDEFWKLLKKEKVTNLKFHLRNVQMMEAECEKMSIQKIIDYDLGIDVKKYAMKAKVINLEVGLTPIIKNYIVLFQIKYNLNM